MKLMKIMSLISFLLNFNALAQSTNNMCASPNPQAYRVMAQLPEGKYAAWWPEFLDLKTRQGDREIWAAIMCSNRPSSIVGGGNCLVNLTPGPQAGKITDSPGVYDGQWTKDRQSEALFTAPNKFRTNKGGLDPGLTFFRHSEVVLKGKKAKPLYHDPVFGNHYHSFGSLRSGVENGQRFVVHRAMNDKWGASIRDYKAKLDGNGDTVSIEPLGLERNLTNSPEDSEKVRTEPKGHADPKAHYSYFDLPMISADGRFFAVNNRRTMTTQIFEITEAGKRLALDLGFETGKVSFAPMPANSTELRIVFHVDQVDPAEGDKMSSLHSGMTKDIIAMTLDLKKDSAGQVSLKRREAVRVTSALLSGDGNFYPKWINDREFIYIQDEDNSQSFVKVDVTLLKDHSHRIEAIGASDCVNCAKSQFEAVVALGSLFAQTCTDIAQKISAREAQLYALHLTPTACQELAAEWEQRKEKVLEIKSLFELRKPKKPGEQRVPGWGFPESYSTRGQQRQEKPANRNVMEFLTVEDLSAVCKALE